MRSRRFVAVLLAMFMMFSLALPSSVYAEDTDTDGLTIQEAIDTAYSKNPSLREAELSVQSAQISRDDSAEAINYLPVAGLVNTATQQVVNNYQTAQINLDTAKMNQYAVKDSVASSVISAYAQAISSRNSVESALLSLENLRDQQKVLSLSKAIGKTAATDYGQFLTSLKLSEQSYKNAQLAYDGSIATLASLLGQNEDWKPSLSSRSLLETYPREELSVELSRSISKSVLIMQQSAKLEIEKSKKDWILPNYSSDSQRISLDLAEVNYEQALNSARTQIEQLYYNIDLLEGQIQASEIVYQQDQIKLDTTQLQYELGLIPWISLGTTESLAAAKLTVEKDKLNLDSSRASLASLKANFSYLTGQIVYDAKDWAANIQQDITAKSAQFRIDSNNYYVNGVANTMDAAPYIKASRTYVPLRYLGLALGVSEGNIVWDAATQTATLSLGSTKIMFTIGSTNYTENGTTKTMDVAPEITNGRTMLPARYVAEGLGYNVGWDPAAKTVLVSK